ncbi:MAG TPA: histidine kinase [Actinomycetota bacterium]|nr:histidine kinase [Actinomycetota bacterium]
MTSRTEPVPSPMANSDSDSSPGVAHRIVVIGRDPFLVYLLRRNMPDAQVLEVEDPDEVKEALEEGVDLVLADLSLPVSARLPANVKSIGIVDSRASRMALARPTDGVLVRPFLPDELYSSVRQALGLGVRRDSMTSPSLNRALRWLALARVISIAVAVAIELGGETPSTMRSVIFAISFLYVAIRLIPGPDSAGGAWADILFASSLVLATDGITSNYVGFAFVAAVGAGLVLGPRAGIIGGLLVATGSSYSVVQQWEQGNADVRQLTGWLLLFPLAALTGNLAARVWRVGAGGGDRLLEEANRVLSTLHRIARALPGGFEVRTIAGAALQGMRETIGAEAGAVLIGESDVGGVAGSFGLPANAEVVLRQHTEALIAKASAAAMVLDPEQVPPQLSDVLDPHNSWLVAPLKGQGSIPLGILLAATRNASRQDENLLFLEHLAGEVAVQLENARLFAQVRDLSVDEERRRIADELHDGVAQLLTHVRMELEAHARQRIGAGESDEEARRLASVVERTLGEVRSTILGLRSTLSTEGLVGSLRSYLSDLNQLGGPEIRFRALGESNLDRRGEAELFRIVQESVASVIRVPQVRAIDVTLRASKLSTLAVIAMSPPPAESKNIRRRTEERARRMGARVTAVTHEDEMTISIEVVQGKVRADK